MCVSSVGKASVRVQPSLNTRELTPGKNLIDVFSVVKDLDRVHTLSDTRESTELESPSFHMSLRDSCGGFAIAAVSEEKVSLAALADLEVAM